MLQWLNKTAIC